VSEEYGDAWSITVDTIGNCCLTGMYRYTIDFGSYSLMSVDWGQDIFIAKIDTNGNWLWAKSAGGTGSDCGQGIVTDNSGNIYVTGWFYETATFGSYSLTGGGLDIFVAKMDTNGNWLWINSAGGSSSETPSDITHDNQGNLYITGRFYGSANFGSFSIINNDNEAKVFVSKLTDNGVWQWASQSEGTYSVASGLCVDNLQHCIIIGMFREVMSLDSFSVISNGETDIFIAKIDSNGEWLWVKSTGAENFDYGYSVSIDEDGSTYAFGRFSGEVYFDTTLLTSNINEHDIFVAKLGSDFFADFEADNTSGYYPSFEVNFTDLSLGNIISWEWDFQNDGIIDSNEQNPTILL